MTIVLLLQEEKAAGLLIAASGVLALKSLLDPLHRYGVDPVMRTKASAGLVAAALVVHILSSSGDGAEASDPEAVGSSADELASASSIAGSPDTGALEIEEEGAEGTMALEPLRSCTAIDGDTLRCGVEKIRLIGIDAPEMPGHCRPGRMCAPGNPYESKNSLESVLAPDMLIERLGVDHFGRTLGMVYTADLNLSCYQVGMGQAVYVPDWDEGGRLIAQC